MKKYIIIVALFIFQTIQANWYTSFEEGQKMALASNRFMIVDFWASWCGPCKMMDMESWNNKNVELVLEDYVKVKIDIDSNRNLALQYGISGIPNMMIMDGNGKVVHSFSGYHDATKLMYELEKFNLSTEYLGADLINFSKAKKFNTAIRISQKYREYSMFVDKKIKLEILKVSNEYLDDAKKIIDKKDPDYIVENQKIELLKMFNLAYKFDFQKLDKKIADINVDDIDKTNEYFYWFLKYVSAKGVKKETVEIESKLKEIDLMNVIDNGNELYTFYEDSLKKD
jgi:thioredoxin-like negative regulator of GroEL